MFKANPTYGGSPKPSLSTIDVETYTGITPQLNALQTGASTSPGSTSPSSARSTTLRSDGYSVFGYPNLGWFARVLQLQGRDQPLQLDRLAAVRAPGARRPRGPAGVPDRHLQERRACSPTDPIPSVPPTPFTPADAVKTPYPYNPANAVALLKSHGWNVVPNGQTTCAKAGTRRRRVRRRDPGRHAVHVHLVLHPGVRDAVGEPRVGGLRLGGEGRPRGSTSSSQSKTFNYIIANYNDANPADAKYTNDWGVINFGGFTDDYYPTTSSIFNTGGDYNLGRLRQTRRRTR